MIGGTVLTIAEKAGLIDIIKKAGVYIGMESYLKERGEEGADFSNNPVTAANGWA